MRKYLEFDDGKSSKFWSIELNGASFNVVFGKTGSQGQAQEKSFASAAEAEKEAAKLVKTKTKKGYVEKPAPAGLAKASVAAKPASVPMAEAPRPKLRVLPPPGPDRVDDGSPRPWAAEREEDEDDSFDLDFLRRPEVVEVKSIAQREVERAPQHDKQALQEGYDEQAFAAARRALMKTVKRGRGGLSAAELAAELNKASPSPDQLKDAYRQALKLMLSDEPWSVSLHHLELLPIMADAGVDIVAEWTELEKKGLDDDEVKPALRRVFSHLARVRPAAGQMAEAVDEAMRALYQKAAAIVLAQLRGVLQAGQELPEGEVGFKINADSVISLYTASGSERLCREDFDEGDDIRGGVIKRYLAPLLRPELEKMAEQGLFDQIARGYIWIGLWSDREALLERRLDEKRLAEQAVQVEENLALLEKTDDFIGQAELLRGTVELYLSNNGIIAHKDTDRILALLTRFLYSGEENPEETARDLINTYDYLDVPKWTLEYIKYFHANFDYKWCRQRLEYLVENYDYQPARDKMAEWGFAGPDSAEGADGETGDSRDYEEQYGYGGAANMARHRDTFSEDDVFLETDTVIARAFANGHIYLRFKKECEQGYADALDWLNRLMKKGYSGVHGGYDLRVRFLAAPLFFEAFSGLMEEYLWPDNDSHAFFCKAVHYPALRERVAEFARLTLRMFDHYLNLDGEYSTVAGTFAAVAASLADLKYMDVATQYGLETDGEHEAMASLFAGILEDHWGLTPETAVPIAVLTMSYDHDNLGLSDGYYKYPQILEAVSDYFSSTAMPHKAHRIVRLGENIFPDSEGEDILKKVKKLFKSATDPRAKAIYANFHNLFLEALEEEEDDEFGKPLEYDAPATPQPVLESLDEDLAENPPCLISLEEARRRGYSEDQFDHEEKAPWCVLVFAPMLMDNPYIYDFFRANEQKRAKISPLCYTVWHPTKCYTLGKVAIDLSGAPYQYGMVVYDKKQAAILYGLFDYAEVAAKAAKKKIDLAALAALKQKYFFMACPQGSPRQSMDAPGIRLLDEASSAIYAENYMRAVMKLEQVKPEQGAAYDTALLMLAELMAKKGDRVALRRVYETAAQRRPEFAGYWQAKLAAL